MTRLRATAIGAALAVASLGLGATAQAGVFTIDDSQLGLTDSPIGPVEADRITGGYDELLSIDGDGTFDAIAFVNIGQYFLGGSSVNNRLSGFGDDADMFYGLYGLFESSGTFDPVSGEFTGATGTISLYLDPDLDTSFGFAGTDALDGFDLNGEGNDIFVGSSELLLRGSGSFEPGEGDIGSFELVFGEWALSDEGSMFFTAPVPFYTQVRITGQFDFIEGFDPGETRSTFDVVGSADLRAQGEVPAPGVLSLFGLGLLGLAFMARRRQSAAA